MTMLNSTVLEVAIGLVFCYAAVALMVSSITEAISSALKLRAKSLLIGVKQLLNDQQFTGLARDVYNHALVSPRDDGKARDQGGLKNMPAYIPSEHFAVALVDSLQSIPGDVAELRNDIARISDPQLRHLLQSMYSRSEGQIGRLQQQLADWFDNGMDRLSGMYKRRTQIISDTPDAYGCAVESRRHPRSAASPAGRLGRQAIGYADANRHDGPRTNNNSVVGTVRRAVLVRPAATPGPVTWHRNETAQD
jgi:hypothetical protein